MSNDRKNEYQVERWLKNKERALSNKWYAIARIDLLIISISGGGIYILFELIKYYKTQNIIDISGLKLAGVFFMIAILVNFVSQFFGYYANDFEAKYNNLKFLQAIEEKDVSKKELDKVDGHGKKYNKLVDVTNGISVIFMILGLIMLSVHAYLNI